MLDRELNINKFSRSECLSLARALYELELELKYYKKIFSSVFPKNNLILKRIDFILKNIYKEHEKIYNLYKNDNFRDVFITYTGYYD